MKIATFNVNSVRVRIPILEQWLPTVQPDVLVLQETKVEDSKFPVAPFEEMGYHVAFHGQQKYNGVAIVTKHELESVTTGLCDPAFPEDCRLMKAVVNGVTILNTYVPNGTAVGTEKFEYKLNWYKRFGRMVQETYAPKDKVVWLGDMNVAPTVNDVYDPVRLDGKVCFHPAEREAIARLMDWGWTDCFRKFTQGSGHYSYWDMYFPRYFNRNLGWRIDHIYASPGLVDACRACWIDKEPRGWERPSDHTPVVAEFAL
ncbi:MAG: exodeoxyribonuclease III [Armatimonadetes bacterium]|nr:exodeoxyribonuclease III [Armatimonadota bacterium]